MVEKIKEAVREAKKHGCNYVAVDKSGYIYAYLESPYPCMRSMMWKASLSSGVLFLGIYKGKKEWVDTLREVN